MFIYKKYLKSIIIVSIFCLSTILVVKIFYEQVSHANENFPVEAQNITSREILPVDFKNDIRIINKTRNFQVVSSEIAENMVNVIFKNSYDKSVRGFYLTIDSNVNSYAYFGDLTYSERKTEILPGETYLFQMPVSEFINSNELTVQAVIFTNNSGDGESSFVKSMQDQRRGEKAQLERGLQILKSFEFSENDYLTDLEDLKKKIESLSEKDSKESSTFDSGLFFGKDSLRKYLDRFNKNSFSVMDLKKNNAKFALELEEIISRQ